jgi:fluoride exporter
MNSQLLSFQASDFCNSKSFNNLFLLAIMVKILLMIGSGSFLGGISRYLITRWVQNTLISAFPYGTFVVNLLGCFLIGFLYGIFDRGNIANVEWRMFLTVGFCGGFTTFSTFANENLALLKDGNFLSFALYAALSVFFGLLATYLGNLTVKII